MKDRHPDEADLTDLLFNADASSHFFYRKGRKDASNEINSKPQRRKGTKVVRQSLLPFSFACRLF